MSSQKDEKQKKEKTESSIDRLVSKKLRDAKVILDTHWGKIFMKKELKKRIIAAVIPASQIMSSAFANEKHPGYTNDDILEQVFDAQRPRLVQTIEGKPPPNYENVLRTSFEVHEGQNINDLFTFQLAQYLLPEESLNLNELQENKKIQETIENYKKTNPDLFRKLQISFIENVRRLNSKVSFSDGLITQKTHITAPKINEILIPIQMKTIKING